MVIIEVTCGVIISVRIIYQQNLISVSKVVLDELLRVHRQLSSEVIYSKTIYNLNEIK